MIPVVFGYAVQPGLHFRLHFHRFAWDRGVVHVHLRLIQAVEAENWIARATVDSAHPPG